MNDDKPLFHKNAKLILAGPGARCIVISPEWPGYTGKYQGARDVPGEPMSPLHVVDLDIGSEVLIHSHEIEFLKDVEEEGLDPLLKFEDEPPPPIVKPDMPARVRERGLKVVRVNGTIDEINQRLLLDRLAGISDPVICTRYGVAPSEIDERFREAVDNAIAMKKSDALRSGLAQTLMAEIERISVWQSNMVQKGYHRSQAVDKDGRVHTLWEDASDQGDFDKFANTKLRYLKQLEILLGIDVKRDGTGGVGDDSTERLINSLTQSALNWSYKRGQLDAPPTLTIGAESFQDANLASRDTES